MSTDNSTNSLHDVEKQTSAHLAHSTQPNLQGGGHLAPTDTEIEKHNGGESLL